MQVPSQPLSRATGGVVKPSVAQKAVKGKSSAPKYRVPVRRSEGKIMSKKTIKQAKGVIEEYNDYRFKMLEVHEQFLQMQVMLTDYSKEWFLMTIRQFCRPNPKLNIAQSNILKRNTKRQKLPCRLRLLMLAANEPQPQPQVFTQSMANSETANQQASGASGWKSPEQKVVSHSEKNGVCCRLCLKQTKSSPLQLRVLYFAKAQY